MTPMQWTAEQATMPRQPWLPLDSPLLSGASGRWNDLIEAVRAHPGGIEFRLLCAQTGVSMSWARELVRTARQLKMIRVRTGDRGAWVISLPDDEEASDVDPV